jgi:hypothetical protein
MKEKVRTKAGSIQRENRIRIMGLHNCFFHLAGAPKEEWEELSLVNISLHGIAFMGRGLETIVKKGQLVNGEVDLNGDLIGIEATIKHITGQAIGCHIDKSGDGFSKAVSTYFANEITASKLKRLDASEIFQSEHGEPCCIIGEKHNCSLYYIEKDGRIVVFFINLFGNIINYYQLKKRPKLSYGLLLQFEIGKGEGAFSWEDNSVVVDMDELPDEMIDFYIKFVANVKDIDHERRDEILNLLEKCRDLKLLKDPPTLKTPCGEIDLQPDSVTWDMFNDEEIIRGDDLVEVDDLIKKQEKDKG